MSPAASTIDEPGPAARRLRILVVDDEPNVCLSLRRHLEDEGHEVHTAADGLQALARFEADATWDLVLTDWKMPGMTGDELAATIKRLRPSTPIVLVTGFADLLPPLDPQTSPFDLIIRKPFSRTTLQAALNLVCSR